MAEGLTLLDVLRRCGCADCRQEHEEAIAEIDRLRADFARVVIANAEVAKLNAEQAETIERLRAALEKAANTFADLHKGFTMMQKPLLVASCQIAEEASRQALYAVNADAPW